MDINTGKLPYVIYACFVCELNNESIREERVGTAIAYDRDFQPATQGNKGESNESGVKKVRRILTKYFDP